VQKFLKTNVQNTKLFYFTALHRMTVRCITKLIKLLL